jgi:hypothetical protein
MGAYSKCTWECLESLLGSVQSSRLGVCDRVQFGASWRAYPGVKLRTYSEVYLGASGERTWERIVKQAGSVSSSAIESVFESVLGSDLESVLRAYL